MTTIQKPTTVVTFTVGEKAFWVTPSGYKETVTVTGHTLLGHITTQTFYGQRVKFVERNGRFVGVEHWGHLAKKAGVAPTASKPSIWDRIKSCFQ